MKEDRENSNSKRNILLHLFFENELHLPDEVLVDMMSVVVKM